MPLTTGVIASHYKTLEPELELHLDSSVASSIETVSSTNRSIVRWNDISGKDQHFVNEGTGKQAPIFADIQDPTDKGVLFDKSALMSSGNKSSYNELQKTFVFVLKRQDTGTTRREFCGNRGPSEGGRIFGHRAVSGVFETYGSHVGVTGFSAPTSVSTMNKRHILIFTSTEDEISFSINNSIGQIPGPIVYRSDNAPLFLGYGNHSYTYPYKGKIYEFRVYSNVTNIHRLEQVKQELITKWGIAV